MRQTRQLYNYSGVYIRFLRQVRTTRKKEIFERDIEIHKEKRGTHAFFRDNYRTIDFRTIRF